MAFQCGFFNSINNDRLYNAEHMNNPYKRIVSNGIFAQPNGTPSTDFQVTSNNNMTVTVKTGEGIFFDKWGKLDANMLISINAAHATNPRIDSIVVRVNNNDRTGSVQYIVGTPSATPTAPAINDGTNGIKDYRLANILVEANTSSISQGNITDTRAGSDCGFVTHLLYQSDISATYTQWQAQFNAWFENLKQTLATVTAITSLTSHYTTVSADQTQIPIQIARYNSVVDILQVYINGMILVPTVDYTITDYTTITLTNGVDIGTQVSFIVYKSVDGSSAETVIQQVTNLFNIAPVGSDGGAKLTVASGESLTAKFVGLGAGFWTLKCNSGATTVPVANGVFNVYGQLVDVNNGWMIAVQDNASMFIATLSSGTWSGWNTVYNSNITLWTGADMLGSTSTITPSKTLSQCKTGWMLVWSDYNDGATPSAGDFDYVTSFIYKKNPSGANWNGQGHFVDVPINLTEEGVGITIIKKMYVYNNRLTGFVGNTATVQGKDACLRAVYEF